MPHFKYRGRDKSGKLCTGERTAENVDEVNFDLLQQGITPIEIKPTIALEGLFNYDVIELITRRPVSVDDLILFARQMSLLSKAGISIIVALRQIILLTHQKSFASTLGQCVQYIEQGEKLSNALRHFPKVFSALFVSVIQMGENTGRMAESFAQIQYYLEFESKNNKQLQSTFRYPLFVGAAVFIALIILNIFVIPSFAGFYTKTTAGLPWQTKLLMASSNFFIYYGIYFIIFLVLIAFVFYRHINSEIGRLRWDGFKLKVPFVGQLITRTLLIRFAQTLSVTLNSGLTAIQAFNITKDSLQNSLVKLQLNETINSIQRGTSISKAIATFTLLSPLEVQIITIGEKNGALGDAMRYLADFHIEEIKFDLKRMNDWLGPILISIISVFILIMAMGIYLPIWNMIDVTKMQTGG